MLGACGTFHTGAKILSTFGPIYNLFNVQRHIISRRTLRILRNLALEEWQIVTAAA
jgi:putative transposase